MADGRTEDFTMDARESRHAENAIEKYVATSDKINVPTEYREEFTYTASSSVNPGCSQPQQPGFMASHDNRRPPMTSSMNHDFRQLSHSDVLAPIDYTRLPVASGDTADDVMLIPEDTPFHFDPDGHRRYLESSVVTTDDDMLMAGVSDRIVLSERKSYTRHIVLSCFVIWLFFWPLGVPAFILALRARKRAKLPDANSAVEAEKLGRSSIQYSVFGIVIGFFLIPVIIISRFFL